MCRRVVCSLSDAVKKTRAGSNMNFLSAVGFPVSLLEVATYLEKAIKGSD
jgi:hypothetical protein